MEIRLHGRGGQGGVTCARILAEIYASMGKSVQAFGDPAGEQSDAHVRAYTRVADGEITIQSETTGPDRLVVLDPSLLEPSIGADLAPGGLLLVNTTETPEQLNARFPGFHSVTVDATSIAREHDIGTHSIVVVNTTIAGAFARAADLPFSHLEAAYDRLGLGGNLTAARQAWEQVRLGTAVARGVAVGSGGRFRSRAVVPPSTPARRLAAVPDLADQPAGPCPQLKDDKWSSQVPAYRGRLAPCNANCPAGNDVVGFVQALLTEGPGAAAAVLARTTPLPAVCSRVCPGFCMAGCNRAGWDGAVDVRGLERWVTGEATGPHALRVPVGNPLRVAVVGSGPAGLSAAYHVARHGHSVVLLEGEDELGGVLRTGIPEYRLPRDVLSQEILAILALGVEPRTGVFLSAEHLAALETEYDAIIIATGLQRLRKLDVGPEHAPWIDQSIAFLGAANSADGATIEGHVVVLGGGNTAMDCARTALRCGADRVTVAYRLSRQEMPAIPEEVQEAMDEGISFRFQRSPRGFIEDDWGRAAILAEVLLGDPDEDGRRQPVVTRRTERFDCDRVLLALGQSADGSLLPAGWVLRGDQVYLAGEPLAVFACGDVATAEGTVVHAIGDGHRVATLALRELGEDVPLFSRPVNKDVVPPSSIRRSYFGSRPPTTKGQLKPNLRIHSFQEVNAGLPDASEAGRCLSCGTCTLCDTCLTFCPEGVVRQAPGGYELDLEFCKGCGICVTECPRDALEMITP